MYVSSDSTNGKAVTVDQDTTIDVEERECEQCGDEYLAVVGLANIVSKCCSECRSPPALFENKPSVVGAPFPDRPLMEFGPLSHGGP